MVLCDTNVWLALALSAHSHHQLARDWLAQQEVAESIFFCRATQQSLLRLLNNSKLLQAYGNEALSNSDAWEVYESFLRDFRIRLKADEPRGLEVYWREYAVRDTCSAKLWMDAYLAAFARAATLEMVTIDRGFEQFEGVKLILLSKDGCR